ncbi:MAG: zinc ABC transporter substrate-binding protein [Candidatus Micrarchaeaceae archaeon]|jgi:zinc/manganese transport system substrate-binding protein|nr:zinc ABC transporter solute-binding protein [Candidatus Micrarchaeota archaeon]
MGNRNKYALAGLAAIVVVIVAIAGFVLYNGNSRTASTQYLPNQSSGRQIQIVAAENFWGSLMQQLGGIHVNVTSVVTDPNSDPHEYESSAADARDIANANIVIVNGVGYDDWALKLISASSNPNQTILNVAENLGIPNGSNPHLWYNPVYVNATVKQMYLDLVKTDPADASYYKQRYENVTVSLAQIDSRMTEIKQQFAGTKVASTESIFVYLANATGLDLVSPPAFMDAVAEGVDPPAQSISEFQNQLESGNVSVLVYNEQTVNPLAEQMKQIAAQHNITIVGVTETIQPPDVPFQVWMNAELLQLQNALNANTLGQ